MTPLANSNFVAFYLRENSTFEAVKRLFLTGQLTGRKAFPRGKSSRIRNLFGIPGLSMGK